MASSLYPVDAELYPLIPKIVIIPYDLYEPPKKQHGTKKKDPLLFSNGGIIGVSLQAALDGELKSLDGGDEPAFSQGYSPRPSYVVNITGFLPFKQQKYSYSTKRGKRTMISRAKVVKQVAEVMQEFIEQAQNQHSQGWLSFGENSIQLEHLCLLELMHVGKASLQPIFGIRREDIPSSVSLLYDSTYAQCLPSSV